MHEFFNAWVNLTCPREYDRLISYIFYTTSRGSRAILNDTLITLKTSAMIARRLSAAATGLVLGFGLSQISPESTTAILPLLTGFSTGILGLNYSLDRLIQHQLSAST